MTDERDTGEVTSVPAGPPSLPTSAPVQKRRALFRFFNRSATLLFQHPTTELNPNKPYKGSISLSTRDLRNHAAARAPPGHLGRYTASPPGAGGPDSLPAAAAPHPRPVPGPQTMGGSSGNYAKRQQVPSTSGRGRPGNVRVNRRNPHSLPVPPYNPPLPSPPTAVVGGSSSSLNRDDIRCCRDKQYAGLIDKPIQLFLMAHFPFSATSFFIPK